MPVLRIDYDKIVKDKISPNDLFYAYCIYHKKELPPFLNINIGESLKRLENNGLVKRLANNDIRIRRAAFQYFTPIEETKDASFEDFLETFRKIFQKSGRLGIMGDKNACTIKLRKFLARYNYTQDQILQATHYYLEDQASNGYKYLQRADYFIFKEVGKVEQSRLAAILESGEYRVREDEDPTSIYV